MNNLKINVELPTAEEFVNLRLLAGMSVRDVEGVKGGLVNSNHMVTVRAGDLLVGMGRVIGDGMTTFQIADMAVHPKYQGKGIGKMIMSQLMNWLEEHATPHSYVSLVADGDAKFLYEKFGFEMTAPFSLGMYRYIKKEG